MSFGYCLTGLWPRRWDRWLMERRAAWSLRPGNAKIRDLAALMRRVMGTSTGDRDLIPAARDHYRMCQETGWTRMRSIHQKGTEAEIEIDGLEHLQRGLASGRGVILWGMLFCGYTLAKEALWRAGIRVSHLSREDHSAPSRSWLGLNVAGRLFRSAETPYLEQRVIIPLDGSLSYLRGLMDLLKSNACVSITGELKGRQNVSANVFGWPEAFATGAPGLAWKMESSLLTCYVVREGTLRYRLVIEPPVEPDRSLGRDEFIRAAVEEFASRLQRHIGDHPGDWDRWGDADIRQRCTGDSRSAYSASV